MDDALGLGAVLLALAVVYQAVQIYVLRGLIDDLELRVMKLEVRKRDEKR